MGSSVLYPIRILCFGDSLTEGYTQQGTSFTPYSGVFKSFLQKSGREVQVVTDGESGDQVTAGTFGRRMAVRCKSLTFLSISILNAVPGV